MEEEARSTRTWQRSKHARPREILEAAKAVFADKGFAATRMHDVAKLAGVTQGTIYLYFKNKQDLYEAANGVGASSLGSLAVEGVCGGVAHAI